MLNERKSSKKKAEKVLRILLATFLSLSLSVPAGAESLHVVEPEECIEPGPPCICLFPPAADKVAAALREREALQYELARYKALSETVEAKAWFNDSTLYYGALGLSLLAGGLMGYAVGTAK